MKGYVFINFYTELIQKYEKHSKKGQEHYAFGILLKITIY